MRGSARIMFEIVGALTAGMAIGFLIAPQNGKKLRKKLRRKAGRWLESARSVLPVNNRNMEDVEEKSPSISFP